MIVKTDRDGQFFVAGNSNWRVAGPFETNAEAWAWIHQNGFRNDPLPARAARPRERMARTNTTVTNAEVLAAVPALLARDLTDDERGFIMSMERRARRKSPQLRLTEKQAKWWKVLLSRGDAA